MASGVSVYNKKYIIYISRDYSSYCTRYYTYSTAAALKLCKCSAVVHCTYIYINMISGAMIYLAACPSFFSNEVQLFSGNKLWLAAPCTSSPK